MISSAMDISKRLAAMPQHEGWCEECLSTSVAGGDSRASRSAQKYGLCGRCYNRRSVRVRHKRMADLIVATVRAARRECRKADTGRCKTGCSMRVVCKVIARTDGE